MARGIAMEFSVCVVYRGGPKSKLQLVMHILFQ